MTTLDAQATIHDELEDAFASAGVRGLLHAVDIDTGAEIGLDADEPVVSASIFKLPVLVELCRQYSVGRLAPTDRVHVPAGEFLVGSGPGLAGMLDDVELSLRDLALLMMSVSDNRATDVIVSKVGLDAVNATLRRFGLTETAVDLDCGGLFATLREDTGLDLDRYHERVRRHGYDPELIDLLRGIRCVTPAETDRTTPRETTRLLAAVWRDEVVGPEAAREARRVLGQQVWPHRLMSGFPDSRIRVSGKTGTMMFVRNEAAVVEYPDGARMAIAVFLQEPHPEIRNPAADRVIGTAAAIAARHLLGQRAGDTDVSTEAGRRA